MAQAVELNSLAVLILFFNKLEQTKDSIRSFLLSEVDIYVLNNGSPETEFKKLESVFNLNKQVHFFDTKKKLGPAGGRNYLIQNTFHSWLFFVDNDITIKPQTNWLTLINDYSIKHPSAEVICPRIYNIHESGYMERLNIEVNHGVMELKEEPNGITNFFPEGGAIVKRTVFERIGFYDENMFAFEGYEFALRALLSGKGALEVHHINNVELIHDHRFQKKKIDKEAVNQRYNKEKLKRSYEIICGKYNIVFKHDFEWWSKKQVLTMTMPRWKQLLQKLVTKLLRK